MKKIRWIAIIACLSLSMFFLTKAAISSMVYADDTAATTAEPVDPMAQSALTVFDAVNEQRVAAGLKALEWDADLYPAACLRAQEASVLWSHTRPDGTLFDSAITTQWIWRGENLAWQKGASDADIVPWWMDSPAHHEVMMYAGFTNGAVGTYTCSDGRVFYSLLVVGNK